MKDFERIEIKEELINLPNLSISISTSCSAYLAKQMYWLDELNWYSDCGMEDPFFDAWSCWFCLAGDYDTEMDSNGEIWIRCLDCGTILM